MAMPNTSKSATSPADIPPQGLLNEKEPIYDGETKVIESIFVCHGKDCRLRGGGAPLLSWLSENYSPLPGTTFTECPCMDECAVGPNLALNKKNGMQVSCSKFKMDEESVGRVRDRIKYIEDYTKSNPPRSR